MDSCSPVFPRLNFRSFATSQIDIMENTHFYDPKDKKLLEIDICEEWPVAFNVTKTQKIVRYHVISNKANKV